MLRERTAEGANTDGKARCVPLDLSLSLLIPFLHSKIHGAGVLWLGDFAHSHCLFLCCLLGAAGRLLFPIIGSHFDSSMDGATALFVSKCRRRGGGFTHATNLMITFHW